MTQEITITPAAATDYASLVALLKAQKLPTEDVPTDIENFIVVKENGKLIGSVGLQIYDAYGLLRSLAVHTAHQKRGLGTTLYKAAEETAQNKKVQELFLITTTAAPFFKKQGFIQVKRNIAPAAIQSTAQFSSICPSTGTVMWKKL